MLKNSRKISQAEIISFSKHKISRKDIDRDVFSIAERLEIEGHSSYVVGGFIRDSILGLVPKDFDIATDATPEQIRRIIPKSRIIGRRFKIVHARFGRKIIEISTFRSSDQRHIEKSSQGLVLRDNTYGSIEEDAFRRDFTINSLYLNMKTMDILDFVGGYQDLNNKRLKSIGDSAKRFREDPVRILRAIRFKAKLGLELDPELEKNIVSLSYLLDEIPSGRNYEETIKMFLTGNSIEIFDEMQKFNLTKYLIPITNDFLKSKKDRRFIKTALRNTDARYKANKTLTPSFLFSVLLWPAFSRRIDAMNSKKIRLSRIKNISNFILKKHSAKCFLPKHIQNSIKEIWELQILLMKIPTKSKIALRRKLFRAGYDFLLLREKSGENVTKASKWWSDRVSNAKKR